jgi:hypothetical protein
MNKYCHHVSGFFAHSQEAENALLTLVERGLPRGQLFIFKSKSASAPTPPAKSKEVRNEVLVDGAIGTAIGTGIGVLGEIALVAANVSLFAASPVLAPLMMMGWGGSLGALIGVSLGAGDKEGFANLVQDAISLGQVVLVAETRTDKETKDAQEVIKDAVGDYNDVSNLTSKDNKPARNFVSR